MFYKRPIGSSRFYDFSGVSGLDFADDSRAFAVLDLEGDGHLDVVLKSRQAPQVRVLQNDCGAGKPVVVLKLRGTQGNRDAIGARVEVGGRVQFVKAGSGYISQSTKALHFGVGLGDAVAVSVIGATPDTTGEAGAKVTVWVTAGPRVMLFARRFCCQSNSYY